MSQSVLDEWPARAFGQLGPRHNGDGGDPTLMALDVLIAALETNARQRQLFVNRLAALRQERRSGMRWQDLLSKEEPPGTIQLVSEMLARL